MSPGPVLSFDNPSNDCPPLVDLLTVAEAAALLKISKSGIRRLQQARRLPFLKIGSSVRFNRADLATYLSKIRVDAFDI